MVVLLARGIMMSPLERFVEAEAMKRFEAWKQNFKNVEGVSSCGKTK
jgi:hypothetical protein